MRGGAWGIGCLLLKQRKSSKLATGGFYGAHLGKKEFLIKGRRWYLSQALNGE